MSAPIAPFAHLDVGQPASVSDAPAVRPDRSPREAARRRPLARLARGTVVAAAMAAVVAACSSGGGEETEPTTTSAPTTTTAASTTAARPEPTTTATASVPESTDPEPTDPPTTPETAPPTTNEEELKAQIAADYVRSWELRNELTSNPTLDDLDARVAEIAAVGTPEFDSLKAFVEELVATGERTAPNEPDLFSVTVEDVSLGNSSEAQVAICYVDNRIRLDSNGQPTGEFDELLAYRGFQQVTFTPEGWLPESDFEITWTAIGVTACPPS